MNELATQEGLSMKPNTYFRSWAAHRAGAEGYGVIHS
jgi:hypothetical protein